MIDSKDVRIDNWIIFKQYGEGKGREAQVKCGDIGRMSMHHDEYCPIPLTAKWLERMGFNKDSEQPLSPVSDQYTLTLPVIGGNKNEIWASIVADKFIGQQDARSYARASVNDYHASNNIYFVHQLQNLYYALTGLELQFK